MRGHYFEKMNETCEAIDTELKTKQKQPKNYAWSFSIICWCSIQTVVIRTRSVSPILKTDTQYRHRTLWVLMCWCVDIIIIGTSEKHIPLNMEPSYREMPLLPTMYNVMFKVARVHSSQQIFQRQASEIKLQHQFSAIIIHTYRSVEHMKSRQKRYYHNGWRPPVKQPTKYGSMRVHLLIKIDVVVVVVVVTSAYDDSSRDSIGGWLTHWTNE